MMQPLLIRAAALANQPRLPQLLTAAFWLLALALGAAHTWAAVSSHSMNADGIVYLDIGDAYMRGDWATAVNPVWSPLYSWLLGPVMAVFRPTMQWEFALVHLLNFAIFVLALLCFSFFWRQLGRWREQTLSGDTLPLPAWAWVSLGYALFIWITLSLIAVWAVTPDMLMAALVFVAAGLIVRLRLGATPRPTFLLLGLVLGLAYLAKAVMFPLAFLFLLVAWLTPARPRRSAPAAVGGLLLFLLISLPYVALISRAQGHFTFGEAGTITYLRYVQGIPYPHWQGETAEFGQPHHPSRQVFENPPLYEFGEPIGGTYPISHNPIYWYAGAEASFDPAAQGRVLLASALFYFDLFGREQGALLLGVLLLLLFSRLQLRSVTAVVQQWGLLLLALAAFGLYALVYVEGRYIGVFVLLFWADLLATIRLPRFPLAPRLLSGVSLLLLLFLLATTAAFNLAGYGRLSPTALPGTVAAQPPTWPGEVADHLHQLGVEPGEKVGVIGYAFESFWARLARVQIVAELFEWQADPFWLGEPAFQEEVLAQFAAAGASAVVAEYVPAYAHLPGWHQVGSSNFYIYLLDEP
ncbi:MAG: hypothetical protein R6X32_16795 [Chloroflexota bacterium]